MVHALSWSYSGARQIEALGPRIVVRPGTVPSLSASGFASDGISVVLMTASPLRVLRGTWEADDTSVLNFTFLIDGFVRLVGSDRAVLLRPGSISYQPGSTTLTTESTAPSTVLHVAVPVDEMRRYGFDTESTVCAFTAEAPSTRAAFAFTTTYALAVGSGAGLPTDAEVEGFSHVVKQLLVTAQRASGSAGQDARIARAAVLGRARTVIERTHRTPRCTPDAVADAVKVSTRSLQRLFEDASTTVAGEIERARVASALALLLRHPREVSLEAIATASGFSSADHLRRALKRRKGLTPSDIRGRITTGSGQDGR